METILVNDPIIKKKKKNKPKKKTKKKKNNIGPAGYGVYCLLRRKHVCRGGINTHVCLPACGGERIAGRSNREPVQHHERLYKFHLHFWLGHRRLSMGSYRGQSRAENVAFAIHSLLWSIYYNY